MKLIMRSPQLGKFSWKYLARALRACEVGVLMSLVALPLFGQTPAGTRVINTASSHFDIRGVSYTTNPDSAAFVVALTGAARIEPPLSVVAAPGSHQLLSHVLTNASNAHESFVVSAASAAHWDVHLFHDVNGNGQLDSADVAISGAIELDAGAAANLLAVVAVPNDFYDGASMEITFTATSTHDASISGSVTDVISGNTPRPAALRVQLSVDQATVNPGGDLNYTIYYEVNFSGGDAAHLIITDAMPSLGFLTGPVTLTMGAATRKLTPGFSGRSMTFDLGAAAAGSNGLISFTMHVPDEAKGGTLLQSQASAGDAGRANVNAISGAVTTKVIELVPTVLHLSKTVDRASARSGDTLTYSIDYETAGPGTLTSVDVRDMLPDAVQYLPGTLTLNADQQDDAAFNGNALLLHVGNVPANGRGAIHFKVVVAPGAQRGARIDNIATANYFDGHKALQAVSNPVTTTVTLPQATLRLSKTVDMTAAQARDTLTYTIAYEVSGEGAVNDVVINDALPQGLRYVRGTLKVNGTVSGDSASNPRVELGTLPAGSKGTIEFRALIDNNAAADAAISNIASGTFSNNDSTQTVASDTATTTVSLPVFTFHKGVVGKTRVFFGDTVQYRIVLHNSSDNLPMHDVVITDTVPGELTLLDTQPLASQAGAVATWTLPVLMPGDSAQLFLSATVSKQVSAYTAVTNRAHMQSRNASADADTVVSIESGAELQLGITLTSQVMEVAQGDVAPLVAEVHNAGYATLNDVIVELLLPTGTAYVPGSLAGADSVLAVNSSEAARNVAGFSASLVAGNSNNAGATAFEAQAGGRLIVRLPAELVAGGTAKFTYSIAIVSPGHTVLKNASMATAMNRSVFSNESALMLRVQRNQAVETLTVLGSVFLDANGNGRMDDGEQPAAGVDVWSEDGAVARSDAQGKFSFRNLRPGTHAFRADPATMPAGFSAPDDDDGLVRVRMTGWSSARVLLPLTPALKPTSTSQRADSALETEKPASADSIAPLRVAPARTDSARAADLHRAFVLGTGVEIFNPIDGKVTGEKRVYVGARGEANMPVALFRGDTLVEQGKMRIDGVYDFLGVALHAGPNTLRVRMHNSFGKDRWDSVLVHLSGTPAKLIPAATRLTVAADGKSRVTLRVRVLDAWGVPVMNQPFLTVSTTAGSIATMDAYPSASGTQIKVGADGWAVVQLQAGLKVQPGTLRLAGQNVHVDVPVEMIAPALPFMLIGTGEIGVGAGRADNFAAITGRGALDSRTSLTISVDTRRVQNGDDAFGRTIDPLSEGRYPMLGDASEQRANSASRARVSARIERGLDYIAFGDVQTSSASDASLTRYMRSVTGAAAQVTTGTFKWSGFGALTSQALQQVQLRGMGTSGPYDVGHAIIPGTEQIYVDVRDRENAQTVKNRQNLIAYVDYEIDYTNGRVLLKQPLPALDAGGNPLFLVITAETAGAGDRRSVMGARVEGDVSKLLNRGGNTLLIGASAVRDGQAIDAVQLGGLDVTVNPRAGTHLHAEVAHSAAGDSSGFATSLDGTAAFAHDAVQLNAHWTHTGDGFGNPSNVALQTTTQDLQVGVGIKVRGGQLRLDHSEQNFATQGVQRSRTAMTMIQPLPNSLSLEARLVHDGANGDAQDRQSGAGEMKLTWAPSSRLKIWGESRSELWTQGENTTGNYYGAGVAIQATQDMWIEAKQLEMKPQVGKGYSITNIGLRSNVLSGSQAWGSYQLVGGMDGASSAAVVGLNNHVNLTRDLKLNTMFERHMGVQHAPEDDAVRALPFPQQETDYWSGGMGLEFLPKDKPYRMSGKAEHKQGAAETSTSALLTGDIAIGNSLALLSRQEYVRREGNAAAQTTTGLLQHTSSIWGMALRPANSNNINGLVELRWVSDRNPETAQLIDHSGYNARMIGAAEMVWSPARSLELGARYALRETRNEVSISGLPDVMVRSSADFESAHADLRLLRWVGVRAETRMLNEHQTGERAWDFAPAAVLHPIQGIEVSAGRRWGTLRDADFAVNGGAGWFLSMGVRMTEASMPTAAAFWRERFGH